MIFRRGVSRIVIVAVGVATAAGCGAGAATETPNIEATVQAAIIPALPSPTAIAAQDVESLVTSKVQATVEALRTSAPKALSSPAPTTTPMPTPALPVPFGVIPLPTHAAGGSLATPPPSFLTTASPSPPPTLAPTPTTSPPPTPTTVPTMEPTMTSTLALIPPWQKYISETNDLALDVAPGWSVTYDESQLVVVRSDEGSANFRVYESEAGDSVEDLVDSLIGRLNAESPEVFELISRSTITLDSGLEAVRLEYRWRRSPEYCVERRIDLRVITAVGPYALAGAVCESRFDSRGDYMEAMAASFRLVSPPLTKEQAVETLQEFLGSLATTILDPDVRELYWRLATVERLPGTFVVSRDGYSWRIQGPGLGMSNGVLQLVSHAWWEVRANGEELYVGPSHVEFYEDTGEAALLEQELNSPGSDSFRLGEVFRWEEDACDVLREDQRIISDINTALGSGGAELPVRQKAQARWQALKAQLDAAEVPFDARLVRDKLQQYLITITAAIDYRIAYLSTGDQNSLIEGTRLTDEAFLVEEQARGELLDDLRLRFRLDVLHQDKDYVRWQLCAP